MAFVIAITGVAAMAAPAPAAGGTGPGVALVLSLIAMIAMGAAALVLFRRYLLMRSERDRMSRELQELRQSVPQLHNQLALYHAEHGRLSQAIAQRDEELARRPVFTRKVYNIATVGANGCGKTRLTFKCWANPVDKGEVPGTKFQRFERTVSQPLQGQSMVAHVFEILDWGGENLMDAQAALVKQDTINAMLMVVDVGVPEDPNDPRSKQVFSEARVRAQLDQFNPHVLQFFFSPAVIKHCQTYVLFINKVDILPFYLNQIEEKALALFEPLIRNMQALGERYGVSVKVLVGSADNGQNTIKLFGHLIERILNPDDFDEQLRATLRGAKTEDRTGDAHAAAGRRPPSADGTRPPPPRYPS
jgi:hypothetical protein